MRCRLTKFNQVDSFKSKEKLLFRVFRFGSDRWSCIFWALEVITNPLKFPMPRKLRCGKENQQLRSRGNWRDRKVDRCCKCFATFFFVNVDNPRPLFPFLFVFSHSTNTEEIFSSKLGSNLDHRSCRRERWPLYHHHGPNFSAFFIFQLDLESF